jgi:hypothetical protein
MVLCIAFDNRSRQALVGSRPNEALSMLIALFSHEVFATGHIVRLSGLYLLLRHRLGTSESAGLDQTS